MVDIGSTPINPTSVVQKIEIPQKQKSPEPALVIEKDTIDEIPKEDEITSIQGQEKTEQITMEQAEEIAKNINKMVKLVSGKLQFTVHKDTERIMIRVVDINTDEVIREIPPEKVLNANAKFREVLHLIGILMDEKV